MKQLTLKQKTIFDFIESYCAKEGYPPTLREIGEGTGISNTSAVRGHISAIEKKGYIQREADKARSIRIIAKPSVLSRLKRQLHEFVRTNEGVLQNVVYGIVLVTRKKRPHFAGTHMEWLNDIINKQAVEHGWELLNIEIKPDHLAIQVRVWANHSAESVAARIKQAANSARLLSLAEFQGKSLWAKQYAVTTDLRELEDLTDMLLDSIETEAR